MSSFLQLSARLRTPSISLGRSVISTSRQRTYAQDKSPKYAQADAHDPQEKCDRDDTPNHPIPSTKAHPTLRDGRQSNLSDMAGRKHEDLPEDVQKHNEEMEHRYDRPYNHIADEGKIENAFDRK